ncbi:hypothetical protein Poli38472_014395 [Pythium oligandrum]|uniref:RNA-binding S4 domain-containing protein n=1 Tax=Pythium oligandrum TaxID=41045 RepID=A0A8K1C882_PYTOL|nr:hypothetical protein Poli38472_014395 [Pythium oligandrum]|eukprot:TMW57792.1 hypothetical protein Poli38472_014395 [Pythium oligandrum]
MSMRTLRLGALLRRTEASVDGLVRRLPVYEQRRSVITIKKFYRIPREPTAKAKAVDAAKVSQSKAQDATASQPQKPVRLAKRIAMAGISSRREAEKFIQSHEVTVNGRIVTDVAATVDVEKDSVAISGRPIQNATRRKVWMAHKLPGELVTTNDPQGRPTIFDRLRVMGLTQHMMPVGRLDFNTEGLLLFTNDGEYARELEHPKTEVMRVYRVLVRGSVTPSKLDELRRGPIVDGIKYRSIHATVQSTDKKDSWLQVRLAEGKNREVRKALAHVRVIVKRLIRVQYGPYRLADLPSGSVLEVRPKSLLPKTKKP